MPYFPKQHDNPIIPPSLVLSETNCWDYSIRAKTNTFRGRYTSVLTTYSINPAAAANAPVYVAWLIYAAVQKGNPTAFI